MTRKNRSPNLKMSDEELADIGYYRDERGSVIPLKYRVDYAEKSTPAPPSHSPIDNDDFVDWLYEHAPDPADVTREKLIRMYLEFRAHRAAGNQRRRTLATPGTNTVRDTKRFLKVV